MDTASRLLHLLELFHERPFWTGEALAERLSVTPRTVRRDITRLRALGHPVEAARGRYGGYQLAAGTRVPPLVLDDHEALAVVIGLRLAATGGVDGLEEPAVAALAKLERVLPDRLRERLVDLQVATINLGGGPLVAIDPQRLVAFAQACRRREQVRFPYTARDGARSFRHVEPLRLVHHHGRWYLVAFDLDRDDWRTFRVDRAAVPAPTGARCLPREEPDPAALVRSATAVAPYAVQAVLELAVDQDEATRLGLGQWGLLEQDDGITTLRLGGNDVATMARWLSVLPCGFRVRAPVELHEALQRHARSLLDAAAMGT
jgi:predicted DNA-binding transcriptional regulator YafY